MSILDMAEVLRETELLSDLIVNSEIAREYRESRFSLENDPEVAFLLKEFDHKKERYEEVQRFGKYHPEYVSIRKEVFAFKRTLDQHPIISRYKAAEKALDDLLIEISQLIAEPISDTIKVPGNNPYFSNGCSTGGCGSGGGCSCGS